ncbi:MAG: hypothetical protein WAZ77_08985 [Candidatus Nitrosopolaris sp.]
MSQITKPAILIVALLLSTMLLSSTTTVIQSAKAALGDSVLGGLTDLNSQIVNAGNHVVSQIAKGGLGFLTSVGSSLPNVRVHINTAYQDIVKGDSAGARTELNELNANFLNDSSLVYGLGQQLNQIAQNNSAPMDSHSRQILSAIGTDLKYVALTSEGVRANSTSNSAGASNSTVSK